MKKINKYTYYKQNKINNLKELIKVNFKTIPKEIAFSYKENNKIIRKTYEEFYKDVKNANAYFYNNYKNKHIGLIGENSYNFIVCFMGIILSGNVSVIFDKDMDKENISKLIRKTNVKVIYYSKNYIENMEKLKVKSFLIENTPLYINEGKKYKYNHKVDDENDAAIFFTSGTTGLNKAVVLSQKNIASDIYLATSMFKLNGKTVSFLPYHHSFGLITSVLMPFFYKKEVFICNGLKDIMLDFKLIKPETICTVPAFVESFYRQIFRNARKNKREKKFKRILKISNNLLILNIDLREKLFKNILNEFGGKLKYIICGGAYLNEKYIAFFRSIGITILNGYGITECSPVVAVNRNNFIKEGSVGEILKDVDVKIINQEICIKGDIVMKGYYNDKRITAKSLVDNYFHTGDLGYIDKDNFLFITGRKKNLIILSNGENINPEIIEKDFLKNDAVNEIVVYEENNRLVAQIYPADNYLNDIEYFEKLIYDYNINRPKSHQIVYVKLRNKEFIKNNNKKILRDKIMEE